MDQKELFITASKYRENLIFSYKGIRIYECSFDNNPFFYKMNTRTGNLSFCSHFLELLNLDKKDYKKENYKVKRGLTKDFFLLSKEEALKNEKFKYLNELIFSNNSKGGPRKYFINICGKILISDKNYKLNGSYKPDQYLKNLFL